MQRYDSQAERLAAIERGDTTEQDSTLQDGQKHYAVVRYGTTREIADNLTGTEHDNLESALLMALNCDSGQLRAQYAAERIA